MNDDELNALMPVLLQQFPEAQIHLIRKWRHTDVQERWLKEENVSALDVSVATQTETRAVMSSLNGLDWLFTLQMDTKLDNLTINALANQINVIDLGNNTRVTSMLNDDTRGMQMALTDFLADVPGYMRK
jgi:hypothetical protein